MNSVLSFFWLLHDLFSLKVEFVALDNFYLPQQCIAAFTLGRTLSAVQGESCSSLQDGTYHSEPP